MKLLKGNIVQSLSLKEISIYKNGGILLDGDGTVLKVYKEIPDSHDFEIIDYKDSLIMQSFSDMHLHAPQYPMLGTGMDLTLIDWLNTYTFKNESMFKNKEYARKIYEALAKELIDNGTTRVCMFSSLHLEASLILMEELEKAGVVGFVGKVNMDRNSVEELSETTEESIRDTKLFIKETSKFKNLKPIITPRFTPSCSDTLMEFLGNFSKEEKLYCQSHLSENLNEISWVKELHPDCKRYWETYYKYGLWNEHTLMAHCVHSDEVERKAMRDYGVTCVHCPDSNINLCSGIAPIRTLLNEGNKVVLGSDIAGGAILEMSKNIQQAIKVSKMHSTIRNTKDDFLSVNEAFYLATSAPQLYFDAGVGFKEGKKLHAIVVDDSKFNFNLDITSLQDRFEKSIYMMDKDSIIAVYSEGIRVK